MENLFLNFIRHVSDNRFWIMPIVCVAVWVGVVVEIKTGFGEE